MGQFDYGRVAGLNWGTKGAYFEGCAISDQPSGRGKIPDLGGVSIFYGLMAKRK